MEDFWDVPNDYLNLEDPYDVETYDMIKNKFWTGVVEFKKAAPKDEAFAPPLPSAYLFRLQISPTQRRVARRLTQFGRILDSENRPGMTLRLALLRSSL